ncbi:S-layer protein [Levilactobacillus parabrevis]|uniref:S-layer protein n=1 Tax=Levilactobacillus parabrevis TaxID=357278 RepID=UPI00375809CE
MKSSLAKSLCLGVVAVSFGAVTTTINTARTAEASSSAKIVSKSALDKHAQNVAVTGSNAIYTKPGTVRGAKLVASTRQVKKLVKSGYSKDYFRAYHMAVTNRGSVYYKIVSMNGKYRGYIYGGSTKGVLAGGIEVAETTKAATMPSRTTGFHLKNVNKNTLWTAPKNTQYKAHKVSLYGSNKHDTFTVSRAETKTREGTLYYYVTSTTDASIAGWIYAGKGYQNAGNTSFGGLMVGEVDQTPTSDNSVKVVYRENGKLVGNATWVTAQANTHAGSRVDNAKNAAGTNLTDYVTAMTPSGYKATSATAVSSAVLGATYGNTVYVDVMSAATSQLQLTVDGVDNGKVAVVDGLSNGSKLSSKDLAMTLSTDATQALSGKAGQLIGELNLTKIEIGINRGNISGTKTYKDQGGNLYHYDFVFAASTFVSSHKLAKYGDVLTANFKATLVGGKATATANGGTWSVS